jgi:hypothetical protein
MIGSRVSITTRGAQWSSIRERETIIREQTPGSGVDNSAPNDYFSVTTTRLDPQTVIFEFIGKFIRSLEINNSHHRRDRACGCHSLCAAHDTPLSRAFPVTSVRKVQHTLEF